MGLTVILGEQPIVNKRKMMGILTSILMMSIITKVIAEKGESNDCMQPSTFHSDSIIRRASSFPFIRQEVDIIPEVRQLWLITDALSSE